jgi:hypothetical protein
MLPRFLSLLSLCLITSFSHFFFFSLLLFLTSSFSHFFFFSLLSLKSISLPYLTIYPSQSLSSQTISYSYATSPFEVLLACPSFPLFGPTAETITYFVLVVSPDSDIALFEISIEPVPNLSYEEGL